MKCAQKKSASGFALLVFLLVLMGVAGIALAGFSQKALKSVEKSRFEHNKEVLQQAKDALLLFAYNYPVTSEASSPFIAMGPGRLPCPDTDNDLNGTIEFPPVCGVVGRFPWGDARLNTPRLVDASGETLWYAVSTEFRNSNPGEAVGGGANSNGASTVNSDSLGTITIYDQTGNVIYDGATAGVAAVIIAPGPAINGQNRIGNETDADQYLDSFGTFDNSTFNNGESDTDDDGFMLGPVFDSAQNVMVINDQFIVITADEVISMAEKATLQAYRDAIDSYLFNTGDVYPWLFDYQVDDLDRYPSVATKVGPGYPDSQLSNIGRVPSIFANYFSGEPSQSIESRIRFEVSKQFKVQGDLVNTYTLSISESSVGIMDNIHFIDDSGDKLRGDGLAEIYFDTKYFWTNLFGAPVWQECQAGADSIEDCNQTGSVENPGGLHDTSIRVLEVIMELDLSSPLELGYSSTPTFGHSSPDVSGEHGKIEATFGSSQLTGLPVTIYVNRGIYDPPGSLFNYSVFFFGQQSLSNVSDLILPTLTDPDLFDQFAPNVTVGLWYYPEIPGWAHSSENDWHKRIMMAIAPDYSPGGSNDCVLNFPCLTVSDVGGTIDDKAALLTMAGEVITFTDGDSDGYTNDLGQIFDPDNADIDIDNIFERRGGDDTILVMRP